MVHIFDSDWGQISVSKNAIAGIRRVAELMPINRAMIYGLTEVTTTSGRMEIAFGVFDAQNIISEHCVVFIGNSKVYLQISKKRRSELDNIMIDCELSAEFPEFFINKIAPCAQKFEVLLV